MTGSPAPTAGAGSTADGEPLPILHLDDRIVAINKPSGLLMHRSPIDRHETRFAVQLLRDQLGQRVYPVHRLDKGTSGALVFALDREAAGSLAQAFATQQVRKRYLAIVRGWPAVAGTIARALDPVQDAYAGASGAAARSASTDFRTLATVELDRRVDRYPTSRYALVELAPDHGRRHQLRRHLAHVSHPIIGDSTYGKGRHNRLFAELFGVRRLLLACVRLEFTHPGTTEPLVIEADPGAAFSTLRDRLDWQPLPAAAQCIVSPVSP